MACTCLSLLCNELGLMYVHGVSCEWLVGRPLYSLIVDVDVAVAVAAVVVVADADAVAEFLRVWLLLSSNVCAWYVHQGC